MAATVALIDYGSGNLHSARTALSRAVAESPGSPRLLVTSEPDQIARADRIVLPGVGAFGACMAALAARQGMIESISQATRRRGVPFLGICVGMQLLATHGREFGVTDGLDWVAGEVVPMQPDRPQARVPHVGWNTLEFDRPSILFAGLPGGSHAYFTHSFVFAPQDDSVVTAHTDHGGRFVAAIALGNLMGVQFHPEKSQAAGLRMLSNFLAWRP